MDQSELVNVGAQIVREKKKKKILLLGGKSQQEIMMVQQEREELKMALIQAQESAAIQILLEACLPTDLEKEVENDFLNCLLGL